MYTRRLSQGRVDVVDRKKSERVEKVNLLGTTVWVLKKVREKEKMGKKNGRNA